MGACQTSPTCLPAAPLRRDARTCLPSAAPRCRGCRHCRISRAGRTSPVVGYIQVTDLRPTEAGRDARGPRWWTEAGRDCVPHLIYLAYVLRLDRFFSNSLATTFCTCFAWDRGRLARSGTLETRGRPGNVTASTEEPGRRGRRRSQWVHQSGPRCLPRLNRGTFRGPPGESAGTHGAGMLGGLGRWTEAGRNARGPGAVFDRCQILLRIARDRRRCTPR